jgi:hypothetical protein
MPNCWCKEQQLAFTLEIMGPQSIRAYGMLMQVSKSVNGTVRQWEASLFGGHRVAKLLSMACTTKKRKGREIPTKTYYVCTRTWWQNYMTFCCKFFIPIRDCGKQKRKRSLKDILGDYNVYMRSIPSYNKGGIIRVELRGSYKNRNIETIL